MKYVLEYNKKLYRHNAINAIMPYYFQSKLSIKYLSH